jgi:lysophospholipase L1-like esterase
MFTIVCYGDSNTHGVHPVTRERFARDVRWPGVLAADVADLAVVIEEGLNGRTTLWDDPFMDGRNGQHYLLPCLRSHEPVDLVVLMLGTNDLKTIFGRYAHEIALGAGTLAEMALGSGAGPGGTAPAVLLVAPPRLGELTDRSELWGFGDARPKSEALSRLYRNAAELKGVAFLDAAAIVEADPADGVHLGEDAHAALGHAVALEVRRLLGSSRT